MKSFTSGKRILISVTFNELQLIQDALGVFRDNRSEQQAWDSQNDPIVVDGIIKGLLKADMKFINKIKADNPKVFSI